jgi:F-type H+-transporting ATPase subunit a
MKIILGTILIAFFSVATFANEASHSEPKSDEKYNPVPPIMEHISDAHSWHFWGGGHDAVAMPLPVILWTDNGLVVFMSSEFHHNTDGSYIVSEKDIRVVNFNEKIYQIENGKDELAYGVQVKISTNESVDVKFYMSDFHNNSLETESGIKLIKDGDKIFSISSNGNEEKLSYHVVNARPIDISITKNVFAMLLSMLILCLVFFKAAKSYKGEMKAPKGIASFMEPLILFIKDDIAVQNIGEKHYKRFLPFLLTVFFFIFFNNLMGLIPIPGFGGANVTGNIAFTLVLSAITLLLTNLNGNKEYWKHVFWMPGAPVPIKIFLIPIELIGLIAKPFALMIRLFANMTAGHIVVLSLVSLTFIFKSLIIGGLVSVPFTLFISVLELLVALLQAYVFTMLSALFIGSAVAEHH